jgi:chromosome segregation ATPase
MEQNDNTGQRLATLEEWSAGIDRRVSALEKSSDVLTQVQISLKELAMQNKFFGEKLDELKKALDKISAENQRQHDDLTNRISKIEQAPGGKWESAKTVIIVSVITAIVGFIMAGLLK